MQPPIVEKPPGHDWLVFYRYGDEEDVEVMSVFGQVRMEDALEEARLSLDAGAADEGYEVLACARADVAGTVAEKLVS